MKVKTFALLILVLFVASAIYVSAKTNDKKTDKVTEANVWLTKDGAKHFVCPVMGDEGVVDKDTPFSIVDGKKYYHCCGGCAEKLTANPEKYLKDFVIPANVVKVDDKGQHFQCSVTGEMGTVTSETSFSDVNSKRYYFCCESCKPKFDKNPEKFTQEMSMQNDKMQHEHMDHEHMKKENKEHNH
ncbi:TRASH domain-containing protein [candidate division KSB1 bacterium]|nr:TRASH domain-containing protein [candidate division KSB1 bacterium]